MKRVLYLTILMLAVVFQSCKDDEPTPTPTDNDVRSNITGDYDTTLTVFNAKTGGLVDDFDIELLVQKNSKDQTSILFYVNGLDLFMSATNIRAVTPGYAFDIAEQTVPDFGTLKGKNYINVDGDTKRYQGIYYTASNSMTIYLEKDNGGSADNYLYEFKMTRQ